MGKELSIALPGTGLVLMGAVLVAAKIWGGLNWPWWQITLHDDPSHPASCTR